MMKPSMRKGESAGSMDTTAGGCSSSRALFAAFAAGLALVAAVIMCAQPVQSAAVYEGRLIRANSRLTSPLSSSMASSDGGGDSLSDDGEGEADSESAMGANEPDLVGAPASANNVGNERLLYGGDGNGGGQSQDDNESADEDDDDGSDSPGSAASVNHQAAELYLSGEPRGLDSNIANAKVRLSANDMAAAAGHHHHHHHYVHGKLDMGAHTGKKGSFGWHDKHPVGGKGRR